MALSAAKQWDSGADVAASAGEFQRIVTYLVNGDTTYPNPTGESVSLAADFDSIDTVIGQSMNAVFNGPYMAKFSIEAGTTLRMTLWDPLTGAQVINNTDVSKDSWYVTLVGTNTF